MFNVKTAAKAFVLKILKQFQISIKGAQSYKLMCCTIRLAKVEHSPIFCRTIKTRFRKPYFVVFYFEALSIVNQNMQLIFSQTIVLAAVFIRKIAFTFQPAICVEASETTFKSIIGCLLVTYLTMIYYTLGFTFKNFNFPLKTQVGANSKNTSKRFQITCQPFKS